MKLTPNEQLAVDNLQEATKLFNEALANCSGVGVEVKLDVRSDRVIGTDAPLLTVLTRCRSPLYPTPRSGDRDFRPPRET